MIYRRKVYKLASGMVNEFNQHFKDTLLPVQLKHGARLIGRWKTSSDEEAVKSSLFGSTTAMKNMK